MKKVSYKSLDQLFVDTEAREALSTRVKKETKSLLEKEAKARGTKISALAAAILDDYADWLSKEKSGKR